MAAIDQHSADPHPAHGADSTHGPDPFGTDVDKEPSVDWGWHGSLPLAGPIMGWLTAFTLFAMLIGNHHGRVEDVFLVGLGTMLVVMLIGHHVNARKARRR